MQRIVWPLACLILAITGNFPLNAVNTGSVFQGNTALRSHATRQPAMPPSVYHDSKTKRKVWGLTEQEWTEYLNIKQGPRGYWSPDLDPLTALGIHADTEAKQRKYARLLAALEKTRVEKELAFQRIYQEEFKALYPELDTFDRDKIRTLLVERYQQGTTFKAGDRALAFVSTDCPQCLALPGVLIERAKAIPRFAVDFYFVGSDTSNEAIRRWAAQVGIPKKLVDAGRITLNHDQGTLAQLINNPFPTLPQVVRDRPDSASRYEIIPLEQVSAY